ncbi:MAG: FAD-dependent oxidoreductase, partial [Muribaculaceae bacterium]|nr:FAD-dependent oxidoreductase [Muribaculaceae bacterium]
MKKDTTSVEYDVIVIGGGATGAGTARDCAMRGLKTLLVERLDFTAGATGRNHGLLHSGARYAHTDPESAAECVRENMILRRIARHCVEESGGLFVTLPEDSLDYQDAFVKDCFNAGIQAEVLDPKEAVEMEPAVNPDIIGAVKVPDGSVDPFRLTPANVLDARL